MNFYVIQLVKTISRSIPNFGKGIVVDEEVLNILENNNINRNDALSLLF
jgi:hypothetical protein